MCLDTTGLGGGAGVVVARLEVKFRKHTLGRSIYLSLAAISLVENASVVVSELGFEIATAGDEAEAKLSLSKDKQLRPGHKLTTLTP